MKRLLPFLLIPVFLTYGPNGVGYSTIVETTLDDNNLPLGSVIACNFVLPNTEYVLLEGIMLSKEPLLLLANTRAGLITLQAKDKDVEFCLISESQLKGE